MCMYMGGMGGVVVNRAIYELISFDVLFSPIPRGFFLRVLRFSLPQRKSTWSLEVVRGNVRVVSVRVQCPPNSAQALEDLDT